MSELEEIQPGDYAIAHEEVGGREDAEEVAEGYDREEEEEREEGKESLEAESDVKSDHSSRKQVGGSSSDIVIWVFCPGHENCDIVVLVRSLDAASPFLDSELITNSLIV